MYVVEVTLPSPQHAHVASLLLLAVTACGGGPPAATTLDSGPPPVEVCEPMLGPDGSETGFEHCYLPGRGPGQVNRVATPTCPVTSWIACPQTGQSPCAPGEVWVAGSYDPSWCTCVRPCEGGSDCLSDQTCACPLAYDATQPVTHRDSVCLPGQCDGPADCGGDDCGASADDCGDLKGTFCRTAADLCRYDSDCETNQRCTATGTRWVCTYGESCE